MVLPSRAAVFGAKQTQETRLRAPGALLMAVRTFAAENGYSVNRALLVLVDTALRGAYAQTPEVGRRDADGA